MVLALAEMLHQGPRELSIAFSHGVDPERFGLEEHWRGERLLVVLVVFRGEPDDSILTEFRRVESLCSTPSRLLTSWRSRPCRMRPLGLASGGT
jgi:hypothetical protein